MVTPCERILRVLSGRFAAKMRYDKFGFAFNIETGFSLQIGTEKKEWKKPTFVSSLEIFQGSVDDGRLSPG